MLEQDMDKVKSCLERNPDCINDTDEALGNTALNYAIMKVPLTREESRFKNDLVYFLCDHPNIDFFVQNKRGQDAADLAALLSDSSIYHHIWECHSRRQELKEIAAKSEAQKSGINSPKPEGP